MNSCLDFDCRFFQLLHPTKDIYFWVFHFADLEAAESENTSSSEDRNTASKGNTSSGENGITS